MQREADERADTVSGNEPQVAPPGTQLIFRTLDVAECFVDERNLGISEIARMAKLSPSTTHRIVRALVARGYLEQDPGTDRYHLGRSAVLLGQAVRGQYGLDQVLPILERLSASTGESVNLGMLDGHQVVVAMRVASRQALRYDQPVGSRLQLHCSSMGKALLAFGAPNGPGNLSDLDLCAVTPSTITTLDELRAEIELVRSLGYSRDREEGIVGVSCIGAPVFDSIGRNIAAIALQGPTVRLSEARVATLVPEVLRAAQDVSAAMRFDSVPASETLAPLGASPG